MCAKSGIVRVVVELANVELLEGVCRLLAEQACLLGKQHHTALIYHLLSLQIGVCVFGLFSFRQALVIYFIVYFRVSRTL